MSDDRFEKPETGGIVSTSFEQWFARMCAYVGRQVDPELRAVYLQSLGRVPLHALDDAFRAVIESPDAPRGKLPKVSDLWRAIRRQPEPAAPAPRERIEETETERYRALLRPLIARALYNPSVLHSTEAPDLVVRVARAVTERYELEHGSVFIPTDRAQRYYDYGMRLLDQELAEAVE